MVSCTNSPSRKNEYMPEGSLAASFALPVFCVAGEDGCCRASAKLKSEITSAVETRHLRTMVAPVITIMACCRWITKEQLHGLGTRPAWRSPQMWEGFSTYGWGRQTEWVSVMVLSKPFSIQEMSISLISRPDGSRRTNHPVAESRRFPRACAEPETR